MTARQENVKRMDAIRLNEYNSIAIGIATLEKQFRDLTHADPSTRTLWYCILLDTSNLSTQLIIGAIDNASIKRDSVTDHRGIQITCTFIAKSHSNAFEFIRIIYTGIQRASRAATYSNIRSYLKYYRLYNL